MASSAIFSLSKLGTSFNKEILAVFRIFGILSVYSLQRISWAVLHDFAGTS